MNYSLCMDSSSNSTSYGISNQEIRLQTEYLKNWNKEPNAVRLKTRLYSLFISYNYTKWAVKSFFTASFSCALTCLRHKGVHFQNETKIANLTP